MTAIGKNPPANLFSKFPGGKKEKKLINVAMGGIGTQSRDFRKLSLGIFPRPVGMSFPSFEDPAPSVTRQEIRPEGAERRRLRRPRGRTAGVLTRPGRLGIATTQQAGLRTTFG